MSEAIPGVPLPPPPPPPAPASVVVLFRRTANGLETFWVEREPALRFAGGFFAFPGGRVDEADQSIPGAGANDAFVVAAVRELFEETGVLLAVGADRVDRPRLDSARRALLDGKQAFAQVLSELGVTIDAKSLTPAGRWITPPYLPRGFDARFFLAELPEGQTAEVWKGELTSGAWIAPSDALARWTQGSALLHPPNLHALRVLAEGGDLVRKLSAPPHCVDFVAKRLEFQRGVLLCPVRTPTLPPATHTNTYVLGTGQLVVIDPGASDPEELEPLLELLRELKAEGRTLEAVILTHHHGDHIGGLELLVKALGVPVWAHARTADRLPVPVARVLSEGDLVELHGPVPMRWRVHHTPGHARGHVCLLDEASHAAIVGDMVAGVGTIVIDPPEGDMADYLSQLARLGQLGVRTLYPSHGPVIPDGPGKLEAYAMHRAWREQKVFEAVPASAVAIDAIVAKAYDDVAEFVWPIAERNTVAILEKLLKEGRVRRSSAMEWSRSN